MSQENVRVLPDDVDLAVAGAADEVIVEEHQVITSKPTLKSAMATPRKLNTTQPNTVLNTQQVSKIIDSPGSKANDTSNNEVKRLVGQMVSHSTHVRPGKFKEIMQPQADNTRYGSTAGSRIGQYSRRSNRAYQSLGASKFDTFSSKSVRPSTSFMNVSRKEAIAKHSQFPKNLFNPLTDQMTSIVGHADERVCTNPYAT